MLQCLGCCQVSIVGHARTRFVEVVAGFRPGEALHSCLQSVLRSMLVPELGRSGLAARPADSQSWAGAALQCGTLIQSPACRTANVCRLGARLEAAVASSDGLACHNLTMVAAHLFLSGALRPNVVHSMLDSWRER